MPWRGGGEDALMEHVVVTSGGGYRDGLGCSAWAMHGAAVPALDFAGLEHVCMDFAQCPFQCVVIALRAAMPRVVGRLRLRF
eukprot:6883769-Pyramimonas_sp.AAC.1